MAQQTDYLLIGHMTADVLPDGRALGGTVSYGARAARGFGQQVTIITSAEPSDPLLDELREFAHVELLPAPETTTFENIYTPQGRIQYLRARALPITREAVAASGIRAPLLHLAPLTDEVDPGLVFDFPDARILLTPQGWMRRWDDDGRVHFRNWLDAEAVAAADIVVFSEEDIAHAPEVRDAFAAVTQHLIVTDGENGGTYYHQGQARRFEALSVDVADLTGAGDVFAACLLSVLPRLEDHDIYTAARIAAYLASLSVARAGARAKAPTEQEIE